MTDNQDYGGVEVHTLGLIETFLRRGYGVELVVNRYDGYGPSIAGRRWNDRVRVIRTRLPGIYFDERADRPGWRLLLAPLASRVLVFQKGSNTVGSWGLFRECRRKFPRIVVVEHLEAIARPRGERRWLGVVPRPGLWWRRRQWVSRYGAACADQVVAVSQQVRRRLVEDYGFPGHKLRVVRNGVPWQRFQRRDDVGLAFRAEHAIAPECFVFGILARLCPEKGVDVALRAMRQVLEGRPARVPYLIIAGDGPSRPMLEALADALGLRDHVQFMGFAPVPEVVLWACDAIVFASRIEGLPLGLLEGMAAGCLPLVTRISGMPEAVDSPAVGWVVDSEDVPALAAAMHTAASLSAVELVQMRERVVHRIRSHFDAEDCYRQIADLCAAPGGSTSPVRAAAGTA